MRKRAGELGATLISRNAEDEVANEIRAIKRKIGKLSFRHDVLPAIAADGFETIDIGPQHAEAAGSLPLDHADPFDRLLVAQAGIEQFVLVTQDRQLLPYGVPLIGVL